ncbi:MAG: ArsR/SmtB family transcription factor [Methanoculleaceae archaeon]
MISAIFEIPGADHPYAIAAPPLPRFQWWGTDPYILSAISPFIENPRLGPRMDEMRGRIPEGPALPPQVEEGLSRCGGIEGLIARLPSDAAIAERCGVHQALADPTRQKILAMLAVQPLCVCVMKAVLGIAGSKLSYHLSVLKNAGLIRGEHQLSWIIYQLTDEGRRWAPVRR